MERTLDRGALPGGMLEQAYTSSERQLNLEDFETNWENYLKLLKIKYYKLKFKWIILKIEVLNI